jgi:hypothetical protein
MPNMDECYYLNFPFDIETLNLDKEKIDNSALSRTNDPIILYIGTGDSLDLTTLLNHPKLKKISKIQVFLFEWIRYYNLNGDKSRNDYSKNEFHPRNNVYLRSVIFDKLAGFSLRTGISITVNCCEANVSYYFSKFYNNLEIRCLDLQNQTETRGYNFVKDITKKEINYKFWLGVNRFTIHRHLAMCHLVGKSGKFSWPFYVKSIREDLFPLIDKEWLNHKNNVLNSSNLFLDQIVEKTTVDDYCETFYSNFNVFTQPESYPFLKTFNDCFVSVVCEPTFFQPTATVTEKTFDSMFTLTPFIMVGAPYTLKYLRDLGFETFDKWWDESYDEETDHEKRMLKIYDLINYIDHKSIQELERLYKEMLPTLQKNKEKLLKFYKNDKILP